jgi:hypothetical protein
MNAKMKQIVEKWAPMLDGLATDELVKSTATMLENQSRYIDREFLGENGVYSLSSPTNLAVDGVGNTNATGANSGVPSGIARYKQIAIPMVRRIFPELLAHKLVGVQPMNGPVGLAYAVRFRATGNGINGNGYSAGQELGYNFADSTYTSATTGGRGVSTLQGERMNELDGTFGLNSQLGDDGYNFDSPEVGLTIERKEIVARTRKLKARWSIEAEQDLSAMHNMDFEEEMMDLMAYEIAQEIDRELVARIKVAAQRGGTLTWNYGQVGTAQTGNADGRWEQEKFRTLYTQILNAAEEIARATRMGPGNYCIVSPKVAVALQALPDFQFAPVKGTVDSLKFGVAEVGTLGNGIKVYRDTFAYGAANGGTDFVVVGYKGSKESETGIVYCPYIPVMFQKAIGQESFSPRAGAMTRYGIVDHLYGSHNYYRYIAVSFGEAAVGASTTTAPTSGTPYFDSGLNTFTTRP